jgi:hypothetical protein
MARDMSTGSCGQTDTPLPSRDQLCPVYFSPQATDGGTAVCRGREGCDGETQHTLPVLVVISDGTEWLYLVTSLRESAPMGVSVEGSRCPLPHAQRVSCVPSVLPSEETVGLLRVVQVVPPSMEEGVEGSVKGVVGCPVSPGVAEELELWNCVVLGVAEVDGTSVGPEPVLGADVPSWIGRGWP